MLLLGRHVDVLTDDPLVLAFEILWRIVGDANPFGLGILGVEPRRDDDAESGDDGQGSTHDEFLRRGVC